MFPLRAGHMFLPIINKPFPRKGSIGHLLHCTNKAVEQEEGHPLYHLIRADLKVWRHGLARTPRTALDSWLPSSWVYQVITLHFSFPKSLLFLNLNSDKMPSPITHHPHYLWTSFMCFHFLWTTQWPLFLFLGMIISFLIPLLFLASYFLHYRHNSVTFWIPKLGVSSLGQSQ